MTAVLARIRRSIENLINRTGFGIRTKLIIIFVIIKVIPLMLLTVLAWRQAVRLGRILDRHSEEFIAAAGGALSRTGEIAVNDSVQALNAGAIDKIERMSTDLAARVANFLYDRDRDILYAAGLPPSAGAYLHFIRNKTGILIEPRKWILSPDQSCWVPEEDLEEGVVTVSSNSENNTGYRNRPPDLFRTGERPLFLEMTFIDTAGNEIIKVSATPGWDTALKNIADRRNTYVRAESYWSELSKLKPGEIYVSDVIGAYVPSHLIGMYNPANVSERALTWQPEEEAYAGRENPNGKRFKGIIRWAAPVVQNGTRIGYVTLALDHDHIMEFTDHITPMDERYVELPSAFEGNYAFIWDYRCRSICHPRHHSIVGYNPETGEPEVPWLEESIYTAWQESGKSYTEFIKDVPVFQDQSRDKKPAPELTRAGLVGLDGRYLNNAPQCTGWFDLTREGGSGSFLILWSGIWKPNTAATIRYYTGNYGKTKRGFGFVAIGAGLEDFQRPARETEKVLARVISQAETELTGAGEKTRELISRNLFNTTLSLAGSAGVMMLLVVLIAFWMANILTRSINTLIAGISRFRSGERQFRFNSRSKDEIGVLADSFDAMAESLNASVKGPMVITTRDLEIIYVNEDGLKLVDKPLEGIKGRPYSEISIYPANTPYDPVAALEENREAEVLYLPGTDRYVRGNATWLTGTSGEKTGYIILTIDVSDLIRVQKQLEKAVAEANTANRHKGDFLARMSHEIRTPMNAIIGMTEIVKKKIRGGIPEEVQSDLQQIEASSQHLLSLINDILDISKIEAGKIELSHEETDVTALVQTVETIIRSRCEEKNINFETACNLAEPSFYLIDPLRLRQVLINLLGNAVKFTPPGGTVVFLVEETEKTADKTAVHFEIRDTGIGISKEARGFLFKPFEQTSSDIAKRYGGTGLGLVISRSIVQLFGGDITVESEEGRGSVFSFTIALSPCEAPQKDGIVRDASGKLAGKRALLVDDVPINRMIVANLLEYTGLAIEEADNGKTALELFKASAPHTYDIIYMDVQMPVMDGYEATAAIRALDRADADLPIVALTANAFKEDIDRAIASGMNAHLAKPIEIDKCIETSFRLLNL
ncbi:MAG: response regulator [Treponema sp.]|jgi:signal transduction histidine kinase/ActR/RegA family two-component response regulator/HAMP domain-containing protein|nr:response regulator [Treponema sp.]